LPDTPAFIFGIPLIARSAAYDWDVVVHHLNATLGSIFNQTDPNFRVIVACTGRPEVRIPVDERLEFVDVPEPGRFPRDLSDARRDKAARRQALVEHLSSQVPVYFMVTDADDLVSNRFVGHARSAAHPHGYVVTKGYVFDAGRKLLAPLPFQTDETIGFHSLCSTSLVLRLNPEDLRDSNRPDGYFRTVFRNGHGDVATRSIAFKRPLGVVPFRAVVYVRNHGINLSERADLSGLSVRRRKANILPEIERHRVPFDEETRTEFNLEPLMRQEAPKRSLPTLTVSIATCRRPDGLRNLLRALRPQIEGKSGREVVVVNDGSHDAAYEAVVEEFRGWIRYEALNENLGIGGSRRHGASLAGGDFIVVTDDDCVPPPCWLDWLSARIMAAPDLDVLAGTTRLLWRKHSFFERVQSHFAIHPRPWGTSHDIILVGANFAIRRAFLDRIGGFPDLRIGEDVDVAGRAALHGARIEADLDWYVAHEPESFPTKLRKHWKYGFSNVALLQACTPPPIYMSFLHARRARHLPTAVWGFRSKLRAAKGFSSRGWVRAIAAALVASIDAAHYDGCAAGVRARRRKVRPIVARQELRQGH